MTTELEIKNFKSIKHLKQTCKRVNIFIGEPNTGKSNILEALGLISYCQFYKYGELRDFVRYTRTSDLFYDGFLDKNINVKLGDVSLGIEFREATFRGELYAHGNRVANVSGDHTTLVATAAERTNTKVKLYKFSSLHSFPNMESEHLLPPDGKNLMSLLLTRKELRSSAAGLFSSYGFKLTLEPHEDAIKITKLLDSTLISYPYMLVSDTLQRVVFHLCAVLSNSDSVLVFEEPESHAFPYYTKHLAEVMGLDKRNNQYFIATHNPYFLEPIIEKTPTDEIAVFVTYFEDYETKVKVLTPSELEDVLQMGADVFLNLEKYLDRS